MIDSSAFTYVVFHKDSYQTGKTYASRLMILEKSSILAAAECIGLKLAKSHTKEQLANELSEYVRMNPVLALEHANDEQILLLKELVDAGPNAIVWKRHLRKYDFLKRMVWVVVNYNRQRKTDGYAIVDELREAFMPVIESRVGAALQNVAEKKLAEKKKRVTLKDVKKMMDGMKMEQAEKVHYLFMSNYIDYSHYDFRDDWAVDGYIYCYDDFYKLQSESIKKSLNHYVFDFLKEWQQDAPSIYRNAKEDLCYWMTCEWYGFVSPMKEEITAAWKGAMKTDDVKVVARTLSLFPLRIAEKIKAKAYEEAAADIYSILECVAATEKEHEDWLEGLFVGGEYTDMCIFAEAVVEMYCHLRQLPDLPKSLGDEMNIQIEVFNKKTDMFGDMMYDSRFADMVCDAKNQYGHYAKLEDCSMWDYWYNQKNSTV